MFSPAPIPAHLLPKLTSTPSTYARHSFALPPRRIVGSLSCQVDPLLAELVSEVIRCEPRAAAPVAGKSKKAKGTVAEKASEEYEVELLDTVIFPEGGGQTSDKGTFQVLDANGEPEGSVINVKAAFRRNLTAVHVTDAPVEVGRLVQIKLDVENRTDLMCQHTGQHLLSGVIDADYGAELETLGWSLTPAPQPCYVELPRAPTAGEIAAIQARCNKLIAEGHHISVQMDLAGQDGTSTPTSVPSNYKGEEGEQGVIRTVEIAGLNDRNPCCGTHYPSLSYLQSIFILPQTTSIRGTNARLYFLVGPRVLSHLSSTHAISREAALELGCSTSDLAERVSALNISARDSLRREKRLREELAGFVSANVWKEASERAEGKETISAALMRDDDATNSVEFLSLVSSGLTALIPPTSTKPYIFALACCSAFATSPQSGALLITGSSDDLVAKAGKAVVEKFGGKIKGGGKGRWQGKLTSGRWETGHKEAIGQVVEEVLAAHSA